MKNILLLCVFGLTTTTMIRAADAPTPQLADKGMEQQTEETPKSDLMERLKIADQIVRLEISPRQIDEELAKGGLQELLSELEQIEERKDDLKALREAMEAVTDKVVSSGKVWDEYSARYATHYTLEELKELKDLLRHPLLIKRDRLREDFFRRELQDVIFAAVGDVAVSEAGKVQKLIDEIMPKLPQKEGQ